MSKPSYTLGFMFNGDGRVILVRKNKPKWQSNRLNGVGGKIEEGETPLIGMIREFAEETGIYHPDWKPVGILCGAMTEPDPWEVHIFTAVVEKFSPDLRGTTDTGELIEIYQSNALPTEVLPNLRWLVPLCQDFANDKIWLTHGKAI